MRDIQLCGRPFLLSSATFVLVSAYPALAQSSGQPASGTTAAASVTGLNQSTSPSGDRNATPTAGADTQGLQDIVVTARRVEESLQRTPVAVTAIGAAGLERMQVLNITDLQRTAPSLAVSTGAPGLSGFTFVSIRGQGNLTPIIANDPAVATYIDGVYVPRPSQGLTDLQDMQRAEVLRGPQGTLFGRNTTGGALNLITQDPVDGFEGSVRAEAGNYDSYNLGAMVNVPLGDSLAARAVYNFRTHDGYGRDAFLNRGVGNLKSSFVRGKIKYDGEKLQITLSGDYNKLTDRGQLSSLSGFNPIIFAAPALAGVAPLYLPSLRASIHTKGRWYTTFAGALASPAGPLNPAAIRDASVFASLPADVRALYDRLPFNRTTAYGGGATIDLQLGDYKLKSITGYRYLKAAGLIDTDGTPAPVLATYSGQRSTQWSQELQLSGDLTDKAHYILGSYYSRETGSEYARSQVLAGLLRDSNAEAKNISKGLFVQLYTDITETLRATTGFRYTWDKRFTDLHNRQILGLPGDADQNPLAPGVQFNCTNANVATAPIASQAAVAAACSLPQSENFDYPAWTVGLDWQAADNIFLYAVTRGAAKAGGWNTRAGSLPAFGPEKVKDVEGGIKATWLDNRLRTNVAVFHSWKKDAQEVVNAFVHNVGVTQFIQNNGDARIWGAEFEVAAAPWTGMEINASLSLLDGSRSKFSEVQRITSATPLAGCTAASATQYDCTVDLSDLPLSQLPKRQFTIGATQRLPLGSGQLSLHGDYSYISSQFFVPVKAADQQPAVVKQAYAQQAALSRIPGYGLFNARIAYELDELGVEIYLFGRNLAKEKYLTRRFSDLYFTGGLGIGADFAGAPRTYGVGVKWKFGQ